MKNYDVVVLGGGSAGTAAARTAMDEGASVVMFNDGELGGLCILRGCMPTKTMLHAAHLVHDAKHSKTPGVKAEGVSIDFKSVMDNKDVKVARFKAAKLSGIESSGYEVVDARARFTGPDTVEAGGETYKFTRGAVIATGSVITIPPIKGIEEVPYLTSDGVMALKIRPASCIVLGTGAIGLELGQFMARMECETTVISRRKVFTDVDPRVVEEMEGAMGDEPNLRLIQPMAPVEVSKTDAGVRVTTADGEHYEAEALIVATGRKAAHEGLGLEAAGVETERGVVLCGTDMRTSNPNIFAAGDASGERLLLHVANWEGRVAVLNALEGGSNHNVEDRLHMGVVFTDPCLATLGLTIAEAKAKGIDAIDASAKWAETGRAITQDVAHGVCILVADKATGEVIGSQILGPRADDLIHQISALMYYHGTVEHMLEFPWYHPTLSEVFLSLARSIQSQRS
ncbi:MAG: pyruvate/2-oxoglutarate dehydrogenase complex dihydrolipoamide dehydrogenase (E3) component [Planctomycetota bacterium]|jgi:pyruvate/2-oxoglutarate dehydrogenase complex dihydrolipoamide dehydrogenase (E3) component